MKPKDKKKYIGDVKPLLDRIIDISKEDEKEKHLNNPYPSVDNIGPSLYDFIDNCKLIDNK